MKQRIQETKITSRSFVYKIYILLIAARHHHPSWKQGNCEAPLHLQHPQGVQGVPGAPPQLQELVHRPLHLHVHPPLSLLLGCQPRPGLDVLLHWNPHRLFRCPNCPLHCLGKSHGCRYVVLKSVEKHSHSHWNNFEFTSAILYSHSQRTLSSNYKLISKAPRDVRRMPQFNYHNQIEGQSSGARIF